jgi:tetratricopeptide (TPR) repeat protein
MPHCQKEFAKPPVSTKEKKAQQKAKREADNVKAAKRAKDIIEEEEEARALKSPEQEVNFEEALADATKSTELKPEFAKGWARLGAANAALERLDAAEVAFQHGLTLEPENVMCLDGINDIQKKREGPTEEDEVDALVKELQGLELTELQSRTLEEGLDKAKVDKAKGSEAPKRALINLVVAYKYLANLIMVELQGLKLLVQNAKEGLKSAISSQPTFKQNKPDNKAMRAVVHHWGAGGGGHQRRANKVKDMRMQHNFGATKFIKP